MTEHYICTGGCKGKADVSSTCQTDTCSRKGEPLQQCDCADEGHHGVFEKTHDHDHALPTKTNDE